MGDEAKDAADDVSLMGTAAAEAEQALQSLVFGGISAAISGAMDFGKELLMGGNRLGDLASAIPLVGNLLGPLASALDNQIDTFRAVAANGASFGNDMFEVSRVAGQAGMSLERFANFVESNSQTMALFGQSTTEGARRFAVVSKGLRVGKIGEQLMAMGYEIDTINEGFISYSEEMAKQGRLEGMSNAQLIEGSQNYLMEMDKLSKVTGLNRKELEQARAGQLDDARVRLHANTLEGTARDNFLNNMTMINKTMPGMAVAFDDLRDGVAQTDEGIALVNAVGDKAYEVANALAEGVDPATLNNMLADMGPQLDKFFGGMSQAQLEALKTTNPALYAIASATGQINRLTKKSKEDIDAEQGRQEKMTSLMGGVEQAIEGFRGKIVDYFLSSPLFEKLTGMFDNLGTSGDFLDGVFNKMKPTLDRVFTSLSKFIDSFMADPQQAMSDLGDKIMGWIGDGLANLFGSVLGSLGATIAKGLVGVALGLMLGVVGGPITALGAALIGIFGIDFVMDLLGGAWDAITGLFTGITDWFTNLDFMQWISGMWDSVTGIFTGVKDWFLGIDFMAPITAVWNSVTGIFTGIKDWWSGLSLGDAFTDAWNGIKSWFGGLFDFDISLPDFTDYLPKWLGGKGKSLFGGDDEVASAEPSSSTSNSAPDTASMMAEFSPDELSTIGDTMTSVGTQMADLSTKLGDLGNIGPNQKMTNDLLTTLNTNMTLVAELLEENNNLTKGVRSGVIAQGDLMTG
jgi:hypothetical protein